jgi:dolichol-phosphate mannosyltransferase
MKKVSVVIAVYYNEGSLLPLFEELSGIESKLHDRGVQLELIFVDDGSGDNSLERLLEIKARRPETVVVKLSRNFGAVHAMKAGLPFVTGDCFVILAADLQDPPSLILEMVARWQRGCKFVMCVRRARKDPLVTRWFARLYYLLLRLIVVKNYPAGGYDLALMDRAILTHMRQSSKNINPGVFAFWLGFRPERIDYERRERKHGKSRWTFRKKLKFFIDTMLGFSIVPLRAISCIGFFVSLLSGGYGALVATNTVLGHRDVPGFATLAVLITFLMGLLISMLGLIGEYLWRIFDELNGRPEAVIDEVYGSPPCVEVRS